MTPLSSLIWILGSTLAMSLIAWCGLIFLAFSDRLLNAILGPLVAFAAGSLIGGAFLHLLPETIRTQGTNLPIFYWVLAGFTIFLCLEQFLNWHHDHQPTGNETAPSTLLILIADGIHNFIGGLAIGGSFLISVKVGLITWVSAAAHELPQEFGDFGILVHGGWEKTQALLFNFLSALMIVPGGVTAWYLSGKVDPIFLLPFTAGNFVYVAASDLIPQIKHDESLYKNILNTCCFTMGIGLIGLTRFLLH